MQVCLDNCYVITSQGFNTDMVRRLRRGKRKKNQFEKRIRLHYDRLSPMWMRNDHLCRSCEKGAATHPCLVVCVNGRHSG